MSEPWNLKEAKRMRAAGAFWGEIGERFGCDADTAHFRCDPAYRQKRNDRSRASRRQEWRGVHKVRMVVERPADRNPVLPPAYDTRNLTQVICGDPLPGRSALDRRLVTERMMG